MEQRAAESSESSVALLVCGARPHSKHSWGEPALKAAESRARNMAATKDGKQPEGTSSGAAPGIRRTHAAAQLERQSCGDVTFLVSRKSKPLKEDGALYRERERERELILLNMVRPRSEHETS